jgi:glycosyltransferase involved in cell wall biosynthesis
LNAIEKEISIIIPAHNEEAVIGRCLRSLISGALRGELNIVVVCNGCTDQTALVARTVSSEIEVIEVERASKTEALNVGDSKAKGFPRFYLDADVVISIESLREIAKLLEGGEVLAASPTMFVHVEHRPWLVRAFYRAWKSLWYHRDGTMVGSGVYALSEKGRARFGKFPNVIGDDGFVMLQFKPEERCMVETATFEIFAPMRFWDLVKVKTRSRFGCNQLKRLYPHLMDNAPRAVGSALLRLIGNPGIWPTLPVYGLVNFLTRIRARRQAGLVGQYRWERDDGSRDTGRSE